MTDYVETIFETFRELEIPVQKLVSDGVLSKHTFYHLKRHNPSLKNLIKMANYLEVSIDFLLARTETNKFNAPYKLIQNNFYEKLRKILSISNISKYKFCKDLNYSKGSLRNWKHGLQPYVRTLIEIADYLSCSIDELLEKETK